MKKNQDKGLKLKGTVVGNKMQKTVKVSIDYTTVHPVYGKQISRKKVFVAHTDNELELGDVVEIVQTKPRSKTVGWEVIKVEKAN